MENRTDTYIAHIDDNGNAQTVKEHCAATAKMSGDFAVDELKDICYQIGQLHDIGKYLPEFQARIRGKSSAPVEHSICGAKEVAALLGGINSAAALLMELCIAGHHTGIPNCGSISEEQSLCKRMNNECGDYSVYRQEITVSVPDGKTLVMLLCQGLDLKNREDSTKVAERFAFFVRYCFSCLTDADSIDTMRAMGVLPENCLRSDFAACLADIEQRLNSFEAKTPLQKARAKLQAQAFQNIRQDGEIYLMNMPTGSGKTLAGMKCALMRALKGKKRIIYVIPYNSIIDQTVDTFEKLFGQHACILRHQSSFSYEEKEDIDEDYRRSAIYACENWDAQIVITTAVQFFESLYGNKRGRLRKVHNMAESVIVFDEAHLMPTEYLQPCLRGISYITRFLHSEAIFLTATMPDFRSLIARYALADSKIVDLVPDQTEFQFFKKVEYRSLGTLSDEALVEMSWQSPSSLIVVNSRNAARRIYELCSGECYHLSTYMTGYDRIDTIHKIRERLELLNREFPLGTEVPIERRITVVSTSLIEAGVDLDFRAAFRELNGLDNVLQTGGRCNREGLQESAQVYIFEREESSSRQSIEQNIMKSIMQEFPDISDSDAIAAYYRRLFAAKKDQITMHTLTERFDMIPFRTFSEDFHFIDSKTVSVVVPRDCGSSSLVEEVRKGAKVSMRKLQNYCCTIFPHELAELLKQGAVEEYHGVCVLENSDYYNPKMGIQLYGEDKFI
jgi:CRISPR-associated endonuclease/helicase Cas3